MMDLDELEAIAKAAPQGNWETHTSNSWRRVMAPCIGGRGTDRVVEPTTHPYDHWPDLAFGNGVEAYLLAFQPSTVRALIDELRAARAEGNRAPIDGDPGAALIVDMGPSDAVCTAAGVTLFGPADNVNAARAALEADPLPAYPDELTPELREVLGWPNFRCGPVAHLFQAAGHDIAKRSEAEQAFVLHWLVKLVLRHGADWWSVARDDLSALQERIEAATNPKIMKEAAQPTKQ